MFKTKVITAVLVSALLCSCSSEVSSNTQLESSETHSSEEVSREEKWIEDLEILSLNLTSIHRGLYNNVSEADFNTELQFIRNNISNLDDQEITIKIMKLIASIGDGHTYVMYKDFLGEKIVPVKFAWNNNKLICVNAIEMHSDMLHSQIVEINGIPVEEVFNELMSLISAENDYRRSYGALGLVRLPLVF